MPPAITEDESSSENEIEPRKKTKDVPIDAGSGDDEDEDDDDEDPDEYVVERIEAHAFESDGECKYHVKWLGYEKKSDMTWEPEANLSSAQDALADYFKKIGGRPKYVTPEASSKKGRKRGSTALDLPAPKERKEKRGKTSQEATPEVSSSRRDELPRGSWESLVNLVETIEEVPSPDNKGEMRRMVYIIWNNGKRTTHPMIVVRQKCPQKLIDYLESHLVFKTTPGEDNMDFEGGNGENGL